MSGAVVGLAGELGAADLQVGCQVFPVDALGALLLVLGVPGAPAEEVRVVVSRARLVVGGVRYFWRRLRLEDGDGGRGRGGGFGSLFCVVGLQDRDGVRCRSGGGSGSGPRGWCGWHRLCRNCRRSGLRSGGSDRSDRSGHDREQMVDDGRGGDVVRGREVDRGQWVDLEMAAAGMVGAAVTGTTAGAGSAGGACGAGASLASPSPGWARGRLGVWGLAGARWGPGGRR